MFSISIILFCGEHLLLTKWSWYFHGSEPNSSSNSFPTDVFFSSTGCWHVPLHATWLQYFWWMSHMWHLVRPPWECMLHLMSPWVGAAATMLVEPLTWLWDTSTLGSIGHTDLFVVLFFFPGWEKNGVKDGDGKAKMRLKPYVLCLDTNFPYREFLDFFGSYW